MSARYVTIAYVTSRDALQLANYYSKHIRLFMQLIPHVYEVEAEASNFAAK